MDGGTWCQCLDITCNGSNVRAARGRAVIRSGGREEVQLEEVPTEQRAPGARPHVPVNKDASLAEFEKIAAAFPVFRVASKKTVSRPLKSAAAKRQPAHTPNTRRAFREGRRVAS